MYQSGSSSVTNTSTAAGGFQIGSVAGAFGYYNLSGGTINVAGEIDPGGSGGGAGTFGQFDQTGGLVNLPTAASSWFLPNRGAAGESSVVNFSGGTVSFVNNATGFVANWGAGSQTAAITISGTAQFLSAGANVNLNQSGNALNVASLNLNGGTFQARAFVGGTNATVNFNGGTLKAGNTGSTAYMTGLGAAYVNATSGGTIDNNGQVISIGQALLAPSSSGVALGTTAVSYSSGFTVPPEVALVGTGLGATAYATINQATGAVTGFVVTNPGNGYTSAPSVNLITTSGTTTLSPSVWTPGLTANTGGGLSFQGSGATALGGASTYTGLTSVNSGALIINGNPTGGGNYSVAAGAAIAGSGSITNGSTVTLAAGANLAPGSNATTGGIGTLTVPTLIVNGGGTAYFDLSGTNTVAGSGFNDLVTVSGNLSLGGSTSLFLNVPDNGGAFATSGTSVYELFSYGSLSGFTANSLKISNTGVLNSRQFAQIVNNTGGSQIDLDIVGVAGNLTWIGSNGASWDTSSNTTSWFNSTSNANDKFVNGDNVTFAAASAGPPVVSGSGNVAINATVAPATVNVTGGNYTFSGSGKITGITAVAVQSGAALTVANTNDYTGGTSLQGGLITLGANNALPVATALSFSSGTLNLAGFNQQIASVSGFGSQLITSSSGNSALTYSGGTAASQYTGTIADTAPGGGTLGLTVTAGTLDLTGGTTNYHGATSVTGGRLQLGADLPLSSAVSTAPAGTLGVAAANSSFTFTPAVSNSGTLAFSASNGNTLGVTGPITGAGAMTFNGDSTGLINFSSVVSGAAAVTVPSGGTVTISSNLTGTLNKNGPGVLILSGSNNFSAQATASSGTLVLANVAALPAAGVTSGANTVLFDLATDASVNPFNFNTNTTFNDTILVDRATLGTGIQQNLATAQFGGGSFTVQAGPNVTSGGTLAVAKIDLTAGSTQTTIFSPFGVVLTAGTLDSAANNQNHTATVGRHVKRKRHWSSATADGRA